MSDLANLFKAHDEVKRWSAERENASARLELARIKERMYELRSQHEPLNEITGGDRMQREAICGALFYTVFGRWPDEKKS